MPKLDRMKQVLSRLIEDPPRHARWLNTIALLEYTGARKMLKSQASQRMSEMILRHAAEESRHAHFFKRAALRIDPNLDSEFRDESLLCGTAAKSYFYHLDHGVCGRLAEAGFEGDDLSYASYLYVTTLIEERADWLYPAYHQLLRQAKLPVSLAGIIAEEENHLEEMGGALEPIDSAWQARLESLRPYEAELFDGLLDALAAEVDLAEEAA
jgi:rubrerythrin